MTIDVSGPGMIVVMSTVRISISHTQGTADLVWIFLSESPMDCTLDSNTTTLRFMPPEPTQDFFLTTLVMRPFVVTGSGTHTYHVTALMVQGQDSNDFFESASMVATYYPS